MLISVKYSFMILGNCEGEDNLRIRSAYLHLHKIGTKFIVSAVVIGICALLVLSIFRLIPGLRQFSEFFKDYQTWFGAILAYFAVGQPIISIANDVKQDLEKQIMEAQQEQLNQLALDFHNGLGVIFKAEDGDLTAFKAGVMVEMSENGEISYYSSAKAKIGRYYVLNFNEKTPSHKLKMLDDVSQDEIDAMRALYKNGMTRECHTILDFEKANALGKTTILLHAAK